LVLNATSKVQVRLAADRDEQSWSGRASALRPSPSDSGTEFAEQTGKYGTGVLHARRARRRALQNRLKNSSEMHMNTLRGLGVLAVFLVGCAVGGASSRLVVPPASAQQPAKAAVIPPPGASRWEQMCVLTGIDEQEVTAAAMLRGEEYWELVSTSVYPRGVLLCFKRPKS
jgi:hypothetical protein